MMVVELYILYYYASPFFVFFLFFFLKNFEKYLNDTMLCMKGHVCDIEHIIYILCKNAYGHFAILVTRNIYANVKLHFYNRENISYELFYKKLFILSYYRQKSQHLCFMFMSMDSSIFTFICLHFRQLALYKSSLTGAFFVCVETSTFALLLVLLFSTFGAVFTEFGTYGFR